MGRSSLRPPANPATKRKWERKFAILQAAVKKAIDDLSIGMSEAITDDGLTLDDVSYILGDRSPSSVGKYRLIGNELRGLEKDESTD